MAGLNQPDEFAQARAEGPMLSPEVSVFWKPLRRMLEDGNPIDPVTILFYDVGDKRYLPFAAVSRTRGNRLILWPPSDARELGEFADGGAFPVHHVTLELSNGETHFTRYADDGQRIHDGRSWKLGADADGTRLWLIGAFAVELLERQVGALEQRVKMPTSDSQRRTDEYARYAASMTTVAINTPPLRGDCFVTVIHVLPESASIPEASVPSHFPMGSFWNNWIDGWPDGDKFPIVPTTVNVGGLNLLLFTASPLGRLKGVCYLANVVVRS